MIHEVIYFYSSGDDLIALAVENMEKGPEQAFIALLCLLNTFLKKNTKADLQRGRGKPLGNI